MAYGNMGSSRPQSNMARPRPQVPGSVNPRTEVMKSLKGKERKRYSTMANAASLAALERTQ